MNYKVLSILLVIQRPNLNETHKLPNFLIRINKLEFTHLEMQKL